MLATDRIRQADAYLAGRTGHYGYRRTRYAAAADAMGMSRPRGTAAADRLTVVDVGAGWTELDYHLRVECLWRGRYIPVDACIDGVDLDGWTPPRQADWFVALELLEHLYDPFRLVEVMQDSATAGIVVSTPNPATTDVLGMDATHIVPIHRPLLEAAGFAVEERSFYGQPADSLFGVWHVS